MELLQDAAFVIPVSSLHLPIVPESSHFSLLHFHLMDLVIYTSDCFLFFKAAARKPRAKRVVRQHRLCMSLEDVFGHMCDSVYMPAFQKPPLVFHDATVCCYYSTDLNLSEVRQNEIKMRLLLSM